MGLRNEDSRIVFLESIYDKEILGIIRKNCCAYIHGLSCWRNHSFTIRANVDPKTNNGI